MTIGVIGAGEMGGAIASLFARAGIDVVVAGSSAQSAGATALAQRFPDRVQAGTLARCAQAEVTFVAVPWAALDAVATALRPLAPTHLVSVVVPWDGDDSRLACAPDDSAAERLRRGSGVEAIANAFTTVAAATLARVASYTEPPTVFVTSDDAATKSAALALVRRTGLDAIDAGPLYAARFTEAMGLLWSALAFAGRNGETIAFRTVSPES